LSVVAPRLFSRQHVRSITTLLPWSLAGVLHCRSVDLRRADCPHLPLSKFSFYTSLL
jgi:hypothetical protein